MIDLNHIQGYGRTFEEKDLQEILDELAPLDKDLGEDVFSQMKELSVKLGMDTSAVKEAKNINKEQLDNNNLKYQYTDSLEYVEFFEEVFNHLLKDLSIKVDILYGSYLDNCSKLYVYLPNISPLEDNVLSNTFKKEDAVNQILLEKLQLPIKDFNDIDDYEIISN